MINDAAYIKLSNRVVELEKALEKLRGNLTTSLNMGLAPIDAKTAGVGGVASFDFQNIPSGYWALKLFLSVRSVKAAVTNDILYGTFNAVGTANYYLEDLYATATTPASFEVRASTSLQIASGTAATAPAGAFSAVEILITDYANANKIPSWISTCFSLRGTTTGLQVVELKGGALNVAGAVSRITLAFAADNIAQYSSAKLYGVL